MLAQVAPPPQISRNTPIEALEVNIGACDVFFPIIGDFTNSGIGVTGCITTSTIREDAWVKLITPIVGGNFVISYKNINRDAGLLVYDDNAGAPNTLQGCQNSISGIGIESLELLLAANSTYWIRITNLGTSDGLDGTLCLYRQYVSDNSTMAASAPTLPLGSCNINFDVVGGNSGFGDVTSSCITIRPSINDNRDGWVKFDAVANQKIAVEYQSSDVSNFPGVVIYYDNGGSLSLDIDLGTSGNQTVCYDGNGVSNFAKVDFIAPQTGSYYIRILNMNGNMAMKGFLCVYENTKKAYTSCADAEANKLTDGDCNIQFNVLGGNFRPTPSITTITCSSSLIPSEAWAAFDGIAGTTYTITYNNDNNDFSEPSNAAVVIYRKGSGSCTTPTSFTEVACINNKTEGIEEIEFTPTINDVYFIRIININTPLSKNVIFGTLCFSASPKVVNDLCISSSTIGVSTCDLPFNITNNFINNENRSKPMCGSSVTNYQDGWMHFVALTNRTLIQYNETGSQDAVLEIYTGDCNALTLVSCVNNVTDGTESIELITNSNQVYFIRVVNITNSGDMNGAICVRNIVVDDVCISNKTDIKIGSCNIDANIPASNDPSTTLPASGFNFVNCGGIIPAKDVWFRFTGNGGDVTIQYENKENASNPALEVYADLSFSSAFTCPTSASLAAFTTYCANDCNTNIRQTETITIPATRTGFSYFVRIANVSETEMNGSICIYNSSTLPTTPTSLPINRCPTNTCATANTIQPGDCGIRFNIPISSGICAVTPTPSHFDDSGVTLAGCTPTTPISTVTADAWVKFVATPGTEYTITYDNNNSSFIASNDVAIAVYDGTIASCTSFTSALACVNGINGEGVEQLSFTTTGGGNYYIRVMNISGNNITTFGQLCLFSGDSRSVNTCTLANNLTPTFAIGDVNIPFNISSSFGLQSNPLPGIPNCIFTSGNSRARRDGWASFDSRATIDTIRVVYDNDDGDTVTPLDPDVNNAALVIYEVPKSSANPCANLALVGCTNVIAEGEESLTFRTKPLHRYFIRVVSTRFNTTMQGRLSIFQFERCALGNEQVRDGRFTDFPKRSALLSNTFVYTSANLKAEQEKHSFASTYGFRQHTGSGFEMTSGTYGVTTSANRYYSPFFTGYGFGFNGWGGSGGYCNPGGVGIGTDACPVLPAPPETNNNANFLLVDGGRIDGQMWCQTIPLAVGTNRYYVFSVWLNSVVPTNRSSLADPQIRISVCEGQGLYNPGLSDAANDAASNLPGVTLTSTQARTAPVAYALTPDEIGANVMHRPQHPGVTYSRGVPISPYGASRACNPSRLRIIGSDIFLPEAPDTWVAMQCVYRVPDNVDYINLCLENLTSPHNGNDYAVDEISFRQCINASSISSTLDNINCELAQNPGIIGIPLNVQLIQLSGKLRGNDTFLNWIVNVETNVRVYEVQRATSGGKFQTIGQVTAQGGSGQPLVYNFADQSLPLEEKFVYYRLNVVNYDGTHGFSPIVAIKIEKINKLGMSLSPNPIKAGETVQLTFNASKSSLASISLINTVGIVVKTQNITVYKGHNSTVVNTHNLKPGIYLVKLKTNENQEFKRLIII